MKRLTFLLLLGLVMAWPLVDQAGAVSDKEIRQQMIEESIGPLTSGKWMLFLLQGL